MAQRLNLTLAMAAIKKSHEQKENVKKIKTAEPFEANKPSCSTSASYLFPEEPLSASDISSDDFSDPEWTPRHSSTPQRDISDDSCDELDTEGIQQSQQGNVEVASNSTPVENQNSTPVENQNSSKKVKRPRSKPRFLYAPDRPPCRVCKRPGKDFSSHYIHCYYCEKCEKFKTNKGQHERYCKGKVTLKCRRAECPDCGEEFVAEQMNRHRFRKHGFMPEGKSPYAGKFHLSQVAYKKLPKSAIPPSERPRTLQAEKRSQYNISQANKTKKVKAKRVLSNPVVNAPSQFSDVIGQQLKVCLPLWKNLDVNKTYTVKETDHLWIVTEKEEESAVSAENSQALQFEKEDDDGGDDNMNIFDDQGCNDVSVDKIKKQSSSDRSTQTELEEVEISSDQVHSGAGQTIVDVNYLPNAYVLIEAPTDILAQPTSSQESQTYPDLGSTAVHDTTPCSNTFLSVKGKLFQMPLVDDPWASNTTQTIGALEAALVLHKSHHLILVPRDIEKETISTDVPIDVQASESIAQDTETLVDDSHDSTENFRLRLSSDSSDDTN